MKTPADPEASGHSGGVATTESVPRPNTAQHGENARPDDTLAHALDYARMGYPVMPCRPDPAPDGRSEDQLAREAKKPDGARVPNGLRDATTDEATIRRWLARPANLAILTPALVFEIDVPKESERPGTTEADRIAEAVERYEYMVERYPEVAEAPLIRSRLGGFHSYLGPPAGAAPLSTGEWYGPDGEAWGHVRGLDNAYLLVPPSVAGGRAYATVRPLVPFDDLPEASPELWEALAWSPERQGASDALGPVGVLAQGDDREIDDPESKARRILEGTYDRLAKRQSARHDATRDEARVLGRWIAGYRQAGLDGLTEADARDVLERACADNEYTSKVGLGEVRRVIRDGFAYGMARPFRVTVKPKATSSARSGASSSTDGEAGQPHTFDPDKLTPELAEALASFPLTDLGNGERFALLNGERVRYSSALGWLVWDGRRWAQDADEVVWEYAARTIRAMFEAAVRLSDQEKRDALLKWARRSESGRGPALMLERAYRGQYVRNLRVQPHQLDANPDVLNVLNGTVDLRTGKLRPHDPADLITKLAPVEYDPNADAPLWRAFQERITAGDTELIAYKRRALGYTITGHIREQTIAIAWGTGANGKSTELEAIAEALGDYAASAPFDTFASTRDDKSRRNLLAPLMGKRFVRAVEGDAGERLAEGQIKNITGGEPITCEYKYRDSFEYVPVFTLWLASNHKPQIRGTDHGIWRRLRLVPYTVTIPEAERDLELPDKLRTELPGILAWLVHGAREWYRDGLGTVEAVTAATEEYRAEMDTLGDFLRDAVATDDPTRYEGSARLHAAYRAHCAERGERHVSVRAFVEKLLERGLTKRRTNSGVVWEGVHLTPAGDALADRQLEQDGGRAR